MSIIIIIFIIIIIIIICSDVDVFEVRNVRLNRFLYHITI
jgi:hypothetical protein